MITREKLREEYIEFLNNYLSPERFGEHRGLSEEESNLLISLCKSAFENPHPES
jgi:hypothetical protein